MSRNREAILEIAKSIKQITTKYKTGNKVITYLPQYVFDIFGHSMDIPDEDDERARYIGICEGINFAMFAMKNIKGE